MWFLHLRMWNQQLQRVDYSFCPFSLHSSDYIISITLFFLLTAQISWINFNFKLLYFSTPQFPFDYLSYLLIFFIWWDIVITFFFFYFYNMFLLALIFIMATFKPSKVNFVVHSFFLFVGNNFLYISMSYPFFVFENWTFLVIYHCKHEYQFVSSSIFFSILIVCLCICLITNLLTWLD